MSRLSLDADVSLDLRVMVVDQDDEARAIAERLLLVCGYSVQASTACTSTAVGQLAAAHPTSYAANSTATSQLPDVLLMDAASLAKLDSSCAASMHRALSRCSVPVVVMHGPECKECQVVNIVKKLRAVDVMAKPLSPLKLRTLWQHKVRRIMATTNSGPGRRSLGCYPVGGVASCKQWTMGSPSDKGSGSCKQSEAASHAESPSEQSASADSSSDGLGAASHGTNTEQQRKQASSKQIFNEFCFSKFDAAEPASPLDALLSSHADSDQLCAASRLDSALVGSLASGLAHMGMLDEQLAGSCCMGMEGFDPGLAACEQEQGVGQDEQLLPASALLAGAMPATPGLATPTRCVPPCGSWGGKSVVVGACAGKLPDLTEPGLVWGLPVSPLQIIPRPLASPPVPTPMFPCMGMGLMPGMFMGHPLMGMGPYAPHMMGMPNMGMHGFTHGFMPPPMDPSAAAASLSMFPGMGACTPPCTPPCMDPCMNMTSTLQPTAPPAVASPPPPQTPVYTQPKHGLSSAAAPGSARSAMRRAGSTSTATNHSLCCTTTLLPPSSATCSPKHAVHGGVFQEGAPSSKSALVPLDAPSHLLTLHDGVLSSDGAAVCTANHLIDDPLSLVPGISQLDGSLMRLVGLDEPPHPCLLDPAAGASHVEGPQGQGPLQQGGVWGAAGEDVGDKDLDKWLLGEGGEDVLCLRLQQHPSLGDLLSAGLGHTHDMLPHDLVQ